jgi:hypothetical protein
MSVQNKELFQKFVEFCDAQPKDKEIDHSWRFSECAIGDYANSVGMNITKYPEDVEFAREVLGDGELYCLVNCAYGEEDLETYGGYTDLLKTYL